jgi:glutathione S-transferase
MTADTDDSRYTLLYHPYSICSLMVLYTYALRGKSKDNEPDIQLDTKIVDIVRGEQFEEDFICRMNMKGEVPVLIHPNTGPKHKPMPDSLKITRFFASKYPDLMPAEHADELERYLDELHNLNYFSLSFGHRPEMAHNFEDALKARLADPSISDRHRSALEHKHEL